MLIPSRVFLCFGFRQGAVFLQERRVVGCPSGSKGPRNLVCGAVISFEQRRVGLDHHAVEEGPKLQRTSALPTCGREQRRSGRRGPLRT